MIRRSHIPCGACGALVQSDYGCRHWRPPGHPQARKPRRRGRPDSDVETFKRQMGVDS